MMDPAGFHREPFTTITHAAAWDALRRQSARLELQRTAKRIMAKPQEPLTAEEWEAAARRILERTR